MFLYLTQALNIVTFWPPKFSVDLLKLVLEFSSDRTVLILVATFNLK